MSQTKAQLINAVDGTIVDADIVGLSSSKLSGALPAISGASLTGISAGKLLRVLTATANNSTTSSGTYASTGCSIDIAVSNSANKCLVIATGGMNNSSSDAGGAATIFRDNNNLAPSGDAMAGFFGEDNSNNIENCNTFHVYDTPGTTAIVTYQIRAKAFSGTQAFGYRNTQRLTVIEIDGT